MSKNLTERTTRSNAALSRRRFLVQAGTVLAASRVVPGRVAAQQTRVKDTCVFCRIVAGRSPGHKLWEDKEFFAFLDNKPINPGHTLLIPKLHYEYLFEMPEPKYERLLKRTRLLAAPLRTAMEAKRIGLIVEGFGVAHCHIHLVPIYGPGEMQKKGVVGVTNEEFEKIAVKIRPFLEKI